jgi:hypothetical protein
MIDRSHVVGWGASDVSEVRRPLAEASHAGFLTPDCTLIGRIDGVRLMVAVPEEDRSMIESMQLAMASPAYRPGCMSTREKPPHHSRNDDLDRLLAGGPAGERPVAR